MEDGEVDTTKSTGKKSSAQDRSIGRRSSSITFLVFDL